ncbi:hypothetical protein [Caenimonas sedimenti]|nr:hypothetical protein [Caenimonas sedimenti]
MNTTPHPEDFPCEFDYLRAVMQQRVAKRPSEARVAQYLRIYFARG